jgi:small conductance mechanosensitive channel
MNDEINNQMNRFYDKAYIWLISFGPRLLLAIVLIIVGFWLIRKFRNFLKKVLIKKRVDPSLRPFLTGSISIAFQILLIFAVMQIVGIQLTIFAALVGAFGVAAGLALSGTLQNFTSGILILILKPFRVGDNIVAQSIEGTVTTIRIFYTVVTTFDNRTVVFPNSKLSNEVIVNLSREGRRRVDLEFKLPFTAPFEKVKAVIGQTIADHADLLKEPVARIGIAGIEDDGYIVSVNAWSKAHGYEDTKLLLLEKLLEGVVKSGIKLAGM